MSLSSSLRTHCARTLTRGPFFSSPLIRQSSLRLFASSSSSSAQSPNMSGKPHIGQSGPPAKKMVHLQSINAIPSFYPEFRNVLWTGESSQLVVMTVPVGGEIGEEVSCDRSATTILEHVLGCLHATASLLLIMESGSCGLCYIFRSTIINAR